MNAAIKELKEHFQKEGLVGVSGAQFVDCGTRKANTTVEQFCIDGGKETGTSPELYALEMLAIERAPKKLIVGECMKCNEFIYEGDGNQHTDCKPYPKYTVKETI